MILDVLWGIAILSGIILILALCQDGMFRMLLNRLFNWSIIGTLGVMAVFVYMAVGAMNMNASCLTLVFTLELVVFIAMGFIALSVSQLEEEEKRISEKHRRKS